METKGCGHRRKQGEHEPGRPPKMVHTARLPNPSCTMDQTKLENQPEMVHPARMTRHRAGWTRKQASGVPFKMPEPHARPVNVADRRDDGRRPWTPSASWGPHRPLEHAKAPEETQGTDLGGAPEPVPCGATLFSPSKIWGAVHIVDIYLTNKEEAPKGRRRPRTQTSPTSQSAPHHLVISIISVHAFFLYKMPAHNCVVKQKGTIYLLSSLQFASQ